MSQTKKGDKKRGTVPFRLEILYKGTKHKSYTNRFVTIDDLLLLEPELEEDVLRERCWRIWESNRLKTQGVIINDKTLSPSHHFYVSHLQKKERRTESLNNKWLRTKLV
jgi:hypothetical protein